MTPTTATGFNDPTAQRLEAIAAGAEPEVVGPLLADALHDPRWKRCDGTAFFGPFRPPTWLPPNPIPGCSFRHSRQPG